MTTQEIVVEPSELEVVRNDQQNRRHSLKIRNRGTQEVRIDHIEATCGCTVVDKIQQPLLRPGDELTIGILATPPAYGDKLAFLTIITTPQFSREIRIPVTLRGDTLKVPFVSHYTKEVTVSGPVPNGVGRGHLTVQTIESSNSPLFLSRDQYEGEGIRIWCDSDPSEELLFGDRVRRTYLFQITGPIPGAENESTRHRHVLVTSGPHAGPSNDLTVEMRLDPVVRVVPSVVNFAVPKSASDPVSTNVVVLDSRTGHEESAIDAQIDCAWIRVEHKSSIPRDGRSVRLFEVICDPGTNNLSDAEFRVDIKFLSPDGNHLANLPICVSRK